VGALRETSSRLRLVKLSRDLYFKPDAGRALVAFQPVVNHCRLEEKWLRD